MKPYGDIEMQRRMVADNYRTDAFAAAIKEVVKPGDVVLDVGTGTGILSMFAAQAGAKKVYAVDVTDIAEVAAELVEVNGFSDTIEVIRGRANELDLEQPVDVVISEWLGNAAFGEGMLPSVFASRDRNLREGGKMLPSKVRVYLAPLDEPLLYHGEGPGFWRKPIHGLDFSSLQQLELSQGRTVQMPVERGAVIADGQPIIELDLAEACDEDMQSKCQLEFIPRRHGVLNGFCVWFEIDLSPSITLDTGPFSPETHWSHMYMSFTPRPVAPNQPLKVDVEFSFEPDESGGRGYVDLHLAVDDEELTFFIE